MLNILNHKILQWHIYYGKDKDACGDRNKFNDPKSIHNGCCDFKVVTVSSHWEQKSHSFGGTFTNCESQCRGKMVENQNQNNTCQFEQVLEYKYLWGVYIYIHIYI